MTLLLYNNTSSSLAMRSIKPHSYKNTKHFKLSFGEIFIALSSSFMYYCYWKFWYDLSLYTVSYILYQVVIQLLSKGLFSYYFKRSSSAKAYRSYFLSHSHSKLNSEPVTYYVDLPHEPAWFTFNWDIHIIHKCCLQNSFICVTK